MRNKSTTFPQGVGIGWRPEIAAIVDDLPGLRFCEVIAESVAHVDITPLQELEVPVIPHGVRLSLGGAEPVTAERISVLANAAERLRSPLVSEHIAFVRSGELEAGHLLPIPRTRESLNVLCENIYRTQQDLPVPLAVENIAALFSWPDDEFTEAEFLAEVVERTGVHLLIDVANVYACARNSGADPFVELARLPLERIAYCHVAGGESDGAVYHDTHTAPVPKVVVEMVAELAATGNAPAFMLERDGAYPPAAELLRELDAIANAAQMDRITTGSRWWAA